MRYFEENGGVTVLGVKSFSVSETLDCGQCFRAYAINESKYRVTAHGRVITIEQSNHDLHIAPATIEEYESIWADYFDLNTDYCHIKEVLAANDYVMRDATEYAPGIRLLKQDFFECLISYIISQNNRIPMIKQVIKNISERFGRFICETDDGEAHYAFPTLEELLCASESSLRECKTGFRDKYIVDACRKLAYGELNPKELDKMSVSDVRKELMKINGVGVKVSDCVMLFSLKRADCFPTDVWIKRIMEHFYFGGQAATIEEIHALAAEKYGGYAGYAQEYLFNYARQFQIGKAKKV